MCITKGVHTYRKGKGDKIRWRRYAPKIYFSVVIYVIRTCSVKITIKENCFSKTNLISKRESELMEEIA